MSYNSAMVMRHLESERARLPAKALATEQMSPILDALSLQFAIASRASKLTALDIGCGDGIATAAALARGGHVMAIDPEQRHLNELLARVPCEQYRRLKFRVGRLPEVDFMCAHFCAVHASRVLHALEPTDLQQTLRKFFRWLYPHGTLFISTFTPSGRFWDSFRVEYGRRIMARDPWPGLIRNVARYVPQWSESNTFMHLMDESVLRRELANAGFIVEETNCYALPWDTEHTCCAVIARCGA